MDAVLRGLLWVLALVYLDNVATLTRGGIERHIVEVADVLECLDQARLTLKSSKCTFGASSIEYLEHYRRQAGVRPLQRLGSAVEQFLGPTDFVAVKHFVHLAGYYRKFMPQFSTQAVPLTRLLK